MHRRRSSPRRSPRRSPRQYRMTNNAFDALEKAVHTLETELNDAWKRYRMVQMATITTEKEKKAYSRYFQEASRALVSIPDTLREGHIAASLL